MKNYTPFSNKRRVHNFLILSINFLKNNDLKRCLTSIIQHSSILLLSFLIGCQLGYSQCNPSIDLNGAATMLCTDDNTDYNFTIVANNPGLSAGIWSGWSEAITGTATGAMFNPANEGPGLYEIEWTIATTGGNCQLGETATAIIAIDGDNSMEVPELSVDMSVACVGDHPVVSVNPSSVTFSQATYAFYIDNNNTTAPDATVDNNGVVTATGIGKVWVFVMETNQCNVSYPAAISIDFVDAPDLMVSSPFELICADEINTGITLTTNYTPAADVEYQVTVYSSFNVQGLANDTVLGTSGAIIPTPTLIDPTQDGSITYSIVSSLTASSGGCNSPAELVMIDLQAIPDVVASPQATASICTNETTNVILETNYTVSSNVQFWLTNLDQSTAPNVSGITLIPGALSGSGSVYSHGQSLSETLTNSGDTPETVFFEWTPQRTDGAHCIGEPLTIAITVLPEIELSLTPNQTIYCSGDMLDFTIATNVAGSGVQFDLVIDQAMHPLNFPNDLSDDQTFPIIIPEVVATVGGPVETSAMALQILNTIGSFDRGRVVFGLQNIHLTNYPDCTIPDIPATTTPNQTAVILPRPTLAQVPDATICSGESTGIDLVLENDNFQSISAANFPLMVYWNVTATVNDGGLAGIMTGTATLYDANGIESITADIDQTLFNMGVATETATYHITPWSAGADGIMGTTDDCPSDEIIVNVLVEPEPTILPNPISTEICNNGTFEVELLTISTPTNVNDIEFLLINISDNPYLNEGNTVTPNITVFQNGQFLSESLTSTLNAPQTVIYTLRPQYFSSRTNPSDPTSATCIGTAVEIQVTVTPTPLVAVSAGGVPNLCLGETRMVTGIPSGAGPFVHLWEIIPNQPAGFTGAGSFYGSQTAMTQSPELTAEVAGKIRLSYSIEGTNMCPTQPTLLDLEIFPLPDVEIVMSSDYLCVEDSPMLFTGVPMSNNGSFSSNAIDGFIDNGFGTATLDPSLAGAGVFQVIYTYFDSPVNCASSDTVEVTIEVCTPAPSINDPCACRDNAPSSEGNATTLENGQFIETVQITAPSGQIWYITEVIGFYDIASPHPPLSPVLYPIGPAGVTMTEGPAGIFTLPGIHIDGQGYSITLTNGTDELSISNTCHYPNPVMDNVNSAYCLNQNTVTLSGNATPSTGIGNFQISTVTGNLIESNATQLDPQLLGLGDYIVQYTFNQEPNLAPCVDCFPGCVQTIEQPVSIVPMPNGLICNDMVNVSLNVNCEAPITPDMVLEGNYPNYGIFEVAIFEGNIALGNVLTNADIGKILNVRITETCSPNNQNFCWGTIQVEDKLSPIFTCADTLRLPCAVDVDAIPPPMVIDNCDGIITPYTISEYSENFDCGNADGLVRRVIRVWQAVDSEGNHSENCNQIIELIKPDLADVVFPPNFNDVAAPSLDCSNPNYDPTITGYPTINGYALTGNSYCSINVLKSEQVLQICEGSFKILRTWSILDWCAPTSPNNPLMHTQIIKVLDKTPPTISCPADLTIGVSGSNLNCQSFGMLPSVVVTDDCSTWSVTMETPSGTILSNGALITNLAIGTHTINYIATDDCGNTASCPVQVTVADNEVPAMVCDELTVVSLSASGVTQILATTFNDGSFDNCSPITFDARRMDGNNPFSAFVPFNCTDVGNPVTVILRATDGSGNTNTCMVTADVQDKISPALICPPTIAIDCTEDAFDLQITGQVTVTDNCDLNDTTIVTLQNNLDLCGTGTVVREFTVVDVNGNISTCTQQILVANNNPFDSTNIQFPEDFVFFDCTTAESLHPDSLPTAPTNYSFPVIDDGACSMIAVNFEDQVLDVNPPACFKIVRTWTVVDWCAYNPNSGNDIGKFQHIQVITVMDTIAPTMICPTDTVFIGIDTLCSTSVQLAFPIVDDCAGTANISVIATSSLGQGFGLFTNVGEGLYPVTYTASDQCGNSTKCHYILEVADAKLPSPFCKTGLIVENMPPSGMISVNAQQLDDKSVDNCTAMDNLIFTFSQSLNDTIMLFDCDLLGDNPVDIWVTDEAGNQDFCKTTITIQNNLGNCGDPLMVNIGGHIMNLENEPIGQVAVHLNDNEMMVTSTDGWFYFEDLPAGGDYTLTPEKDINLLNGVTTFDLVLISRHVLNVEKLDSPYKIIAADINNSGTISTMDLVALRRAILKVDDHFPNNKAWRFIKNDYEFPDSTNPFAETIPEFINFNNLTTNQNLTDFIAIKVGDVNGNASPLNLGGTDDRSSDNPMLIKVSNQYVKAGETISIQFSTDDLTNIIGFQFAIQFDPETLIYLETEQTGLLAKEHLGLNQVNEGIILSSWNQMNTLFTGSKNLLTISFKALKGGLVSEFLNFDYPIFLAEAYKKGRKQPQLETTNVVFSFESNHPKNNAAILYQNQPNPFQNETSVIFKLNEPDFVTLKFFDTNGILLKKIKGFFESGSHVIPVYREELNTSGIVFYQLETTEKTAVKKMILIDK